MHSKSPGVLLIGHKGEVNALSWQNPLEMLWSNFCHLGSEFTNSDQLGCIDYVELYQLGYKQLYFHVVFENSISSFSEIF